MFGAGVYNLGMLPASRSLPEPTDAPPGSEAKIKVLTERRAAGQQLWHPADARIPVATPAPVRLPPERQVRGLTWLKRKQRWRACPTIGGQRVYLGLFRTEDEAAAAVRQALACEGCLAC
jgi:hypothetical protein